MRISDGNSDVCSSDLPAGGGKAVILADKARAKTPEMLAAFARAVDQLAGRYITAQDVGMSEQGMVALSSVTPHVAGLPGTRGCGPAPFTASGVHCAWGVRTSSELAARRWRGVGLARQQE